MIKDILKQVAICIVFVALFMGMQLAGQVVAGQGYMLYGQLSGSQMSPEELAVGANQLVEENIELITMLSGCVTILATWIFSKVRKKKFVEDYNLTPFNTKNLIPLVLMAVGYDLVIGGVFTLLPESLADDYAGSLSDPGAGIQGIVISFLFAAVVAPIVEELIFRGVLMRRLNKVMNIFIAAFLSSLTFGLLHGNIVQNTYATVLGLVMAFVAVRCGSILSSIFFHVVFNSIGNFGLIGLLVGDSLVPNIIAGIIGLVIVITMTIWIIKINDKKRDVTAAA